MESIDTLTRTAALRTEDSGVRTVLVAVSGTGDDAPSLEDAITVAGLFAAHLQVLYTHVDPTELAISMGAYDPMGCAGFASTIDGLIEDADKRQQAAKQTFDDLCCSASLQMRSQGDSTAEWIVETGVDAECLVKRGRAADLIVFTRGRTDDDTPVDMIEAALIGCGKPILILPYDPATLSLDTVAVAWKDTPEAARAITGAQPFIRRAKDLLLVTVEEEGRAPDRSSGWVLESLRRHNPVCAQVHLPTDPRGPVDVLLEGVARRGVNLLVMGGYGHSRAREIIFGGFTRRLLRSCGVPVLMVH